MDKNKDNSSISPEHNSENRDPDDRQRENINSEDNIFESNISKNTASENNTTKDTTSKKSDTSSHEEDSDDLQIMQDSEDIEEILKAYEEEINTIFTSHFDDSVDSSSEISLDMLFPDRDTRLFPETAEKLEDTEKLEDIESLDDRESLEITKSLENAKKQENTENLKSTPKISDADLEELESIEKAEGLTFSDELDELTGKTIQCALIITPLKEAKVLAAFCALSQLSVLCINSAEGAIGYIDTKNIDDAIEVAQKLTSAVVGMATILVVRKKIGIEAHLWLNGSENESIAPPLLLAQQPDFVEDLLVGEANISLLEHEGFQLIDSDSLNPLKALQIINSSSSLNDSADDADNNNKEEDLKDSDKSEDIDNKDTNNKDSDNN